jgi:hypothetical protein
VERFESSGLTFDVSDEGLDSGDVVVLLHGCPATHASWRAVTPKLIAAGARPPWAARVSARTAGR